MIAMAEVSCPGTGSVEVPCCNDDGDCQGECFDADCSDCTCTESIVQGPLVDDEHVLRLAEASGVDPELVAKAYRARLEIMESDERFRLEGDVDDGRIDSLAPADGRERRAGTTVRVRQPALYSVLNADTYGEAFREAKAAKRSGDLAIEHGSAIGSLKFAVASLAYSVGSTLGLVPDGASAGGSLG